MAASERPTVDQYFMDMTHLVKARGTCPRRRVGAVVVKDKRVLTTGYNGAPRNFPHPIDVGCLRDELSVPKGMMADICPCLHAEQNAIIQAATTGVSIEGAELYCTTQPCTQCSRMIANCGIKRVTFEEEYPDPLAIGILTTSGVSIWQWDAATKAARPYARTNTFEQAQDALRKLYRAGGNIAAPRPLAGQPLPGASPVAPAAPQRAPFAARPDAQRASPPVVVAASAAPLHASQVTPKPSAIADAPESPADGGDTPAEDELAEAKRLGVRDLRDDPDRAATIRRLARERVERERAARSGAPQP